MKLGARSFGAALVSLWLSTSLAHAQQKPSGPSTVRPPLQETTNTKATTPKDILKKIIDTTPADDPQLPELLQRYGEICFQEARSKNATLFTLDNDLYAAKQKKDDAKAKKVQTQIDTTKKEMAKARLEAFESYLKVINNHKTYKKRDEVLYYAGYNLMELSQEYYTSAEVLRDQAKTEEADALQAKSETYKTKALEFYKGIIKDYSTSVYAPDALFALGQDYFYKNDIAPAQRVFAKIVSDYPNTTAYGYALYMLGWCSLNLGDPKEAVTKWVETITYARKEPSAKDLEKDAVRDIPKAYAQFGTPEKARGFFQKIAAQSYPTMLKRLAEVYFEQGQFKESIYVYKDLINLEPDSNDNYLYQYQVAQATFKLTSQGVSRAEVIKELKSLSSMYQAMQTRKAPQEKTRDAGEMTAQLLQELATNWDKECEKTRTPGCYENVKPLYEQYLQNFPEAQNIYKMSWYYAELLFKMADPALGNDAKYWEPAAEAYVSVVELDPKGEHSKDAAYAAVYSYKMTSDQSKLTRAQTPTPLTDKEKKKVRAFELYLKSEPNGKVSSYAYAFIGREYWLHALDQEALPYLKEVVEKRSQEPIALDAADLLLDSLQGAKQEKELISYAEKFLRVSPFADDAELTKRATGVLLPIYTQKCQAAYDANNFGEAASCFVTMLEQFKGLGEEQIRKLDYNIALSLEKNKQLGLAIDYRNQIIAQWPKSEEAQKSLYALGRLYSDIGMYKKSAETYEQFAKAYPDATDAALALNYAAIFREGLGEYDSAEEDNKKYLQIAAKKGEEQKSIAEAAFRAAKLVERAGNEKKTLAAYEEYLKTYASASSLDNTLYARTWLAAYQWKNGKKEDALSRCQEVIKTVTGLGASIEQLNSGLDAAAQCQFYLAEQGYQAFIDLKLPSPLDLNTFATWLGDMKRLRDETSQLYLKVTAYNSKAWTLAALAQIGVMSVTFMEKIRALPYPEKIMYNGKNVKLSSLPKAEQEAFKEAFRNILIDLTIPLEDDAKVAFELCLEGSKKASFYNESSDLCEKNLNKMFPALYPLASEWKVSPDQEASIAVPASLVTVLR